MKYDKSVPIVLSSVGFVLLGIYSPGQPLHNSALAAVSPVISAKTEQSSIAQGGQSIAPASQTEKVRLTLKTATVSLKKGKNIFMLTIVDAKTGKPLAKQTVQAQIIMTAKEMDAMGMKGMGEGSAKTVVKPATAPGTFAIETNIPFGGNWQLRVNLKDVKPPASAVFNLAVK